LVRYSAILVKKHIQTRNTSIPTVLFMEHSRSWSVILKFLWENIQTRNTSKSTFLFMGSLKVGQWFWNYCGRAYPNRNQHFYSWSILRVGQWFCNSCGRTYSNKKHFKTLVIIHGAFYKLVIDSYILVGKHIQRSII
jgi:hypothetical protein